MRTEAQLCGAAYGASFFGAIGEVRGISSIWMRCYQILQELRVVLEDYHTNYGVRRNGREAYVCMGMDTTVGFSARCLVKHTHPNAQKQESAAVGCMPRKRATLPRAPRQTNTLPTSLATTKRLRLGDGTESCPAHL